MHPPPGWPTKLVLASESPRRLQLLRSIGLEPEVRPAHIDESPHIGEAPIEYVRRLAEDKALALSWSDNHIIAADTTVSLDGEVLGKPIDNSDALRMLSRLSGHTHQVYTGVAIRYQQHIETIAVRSDITFCNAEHDLLRWYVETGEPLGKAGSYAIQGIGSILVSEIHGSVTNVMGLPLTELHSLLCARYSAAGPQSP